MTANLWTMLVANVLFPLHEMAKGHDSTARLRALEQSQWWSTDRILQLQVDHLREFLSAVSTRVPYFQKVLAEAGFSVAEIRDAGALARIPLLTKSIIRANTDALKADDAGPLKRYNTGGSSGEPLVFYMGKARISHDVAAKARATRWWGVEIGDPEMVVWGSPIELGAQDRIRILRDRLFRSELLPAFDLSPGNLDAFVTRIRERRPRMLFGYPSALSLIGGHARRSNVRLDNLGIRVVFVTSERLYDHQRGLLQEVFGCPVANGYGARDAGFIAHECPAGGMHVSAEDIIVEIVGPNGRPAPAGESGEIVVTHLATREFPFLRYRTGDIASLDTRQCACGRGLPMLKDIQGRSSDFIVATDGTVMHGLALIYVLRDLSGIAGFKIVQEAVDLVRVQVVPGPGFGTSVERAITDGLRARLGATVAIEIERVADIPPEKSGKFRYVVSRVPVTA